MQQMGELNPLTDDEVMAEEAEGNHICSAYKQHTLHL